MKQKILFYLFAVLSVILFTKVSKEIYLYVSSVWGWDFGRLIDLILLAFYFVIIIPCAIFLTHQLVKFLVAKGIEKPRNYTILLIFLVALGSLYFYNEYRAKPLGQVLGVKESNFESLQIRGGAGEVQITDIDDVQVFIQFLNKYNVKKSMKGNGDLSGLESFGLFVDTKRLPSTIGAISPDKLYLLGRGEGNYIVTNGPIDMNWVEDFVQTQQQGE
ncbi:hypothetical protein [Alkalihalobacillus pseudalcaliphilus]|uniref:hypothetical protein n=1 Tax=Alkalihalobacillus pseudalcaliphilus TaxID=79884 RepID=UPI00064E0B8D|nr:hypothetical protein [Alkalihalobacillus pseudalcaliphilus]KMK74976.1 hypothetical protein AB990_15985 [Alkalihalobacillus pseudalcaliphilus]